MRTILFCLITCFSALSFSSSHAIAQVLYGSLVGTITDQSKAVVPNATVKVSNTETGLTRETSADSSGNYSIPNLLEGDYNLQISASGFKPLTQKGVRIQINNVTHMDASLEIGVATESVTVAAAAAQLQTTKSDVNTTLGSQAIENLPLPGYRNFQSLINFVPGATPGRFQNAVIDTPQRDLSTNVNGQERGANNTRVDGAANILVTMPHHMVYVPPVESIDEVSISSNNFDAEQGITGGAAVTVVTKSGTNEFHGSAFGFHANNATRAFLWDENRAGVTAKPKGIRNMDGVSLGGPIKRNKLFFFTDWEGTFERVGYSNLFSVPAGDFRSGDFSRMLGSQILNASGNAILIPTTEGGNVPLRQGMIFDPFTGNRTGQAARSFRAAGV